MIRATWKSPFEPSRKEGRAESCILYAVSPIYTIDKYVRIAKELQKLGSDVFSIHDNSGVLPPQISFELVSALKKELHIPISLYCHCAAGLAEMSYFEGCRAGADILDCAIFPLWAGASFLAMQAMVATFHQTVYETGLDLNLLGEIKEYFSKLSGCPDGCRLPKNRVFRRIGRQPI